MSSLGKRKYVPAASRRTALAKRSRLALVVRSRVPRPMPGLPKETIVEMTYVKGGSLDSTSGVIARQLFRANSIFDPDATGTGHQPLGHDQWAQLYTNYVVLSSDITVEFTPGYGQTVISVAGVYNGPTITTALTTYEEYIEQGKSFWTQVPGSQAIMPIRRYAHFDAKKEFNVKDVKDNVARIGATFGANPPDQSAFYVWAQSLDQVTTSNVNYLAFIRYKVLMSEPTEVPQS